MSRSGRAGGALRMAACLGVMAVGLFGCSSSKGSTAQAPVDAASTSTSTSVTAAPTTAALSPTTAATTTAPPSPTAAAPPAPATTPAASAAAATTTVPTTAPATTIPPSKTTAAPTTAPVGPPFHKYDADPAAAAYQKWQPVEDEAYFRLEGNYPPLVALSTPNRITFEVSDLAAHKKAGDHQVGLTQVVVIGVTTTSPIRSTLRTCQNLTSGYWVDAVGKRVDKLNEKWEPGNVAMVMQDGVWKVDSIYDGSFSCKALP